MSLPAWSLMSTEGKAQQTNIHTNTALQMVTHSGVAKYKGHEDLK